MVLKLTNNVSKKTYEYTVIDLEDSTLYYHFDNFVLEDNMDDGEYNYELFDENEKMVAQGLLQIGLYTSENKVYSENVKTYKQYNSN